MTSNQLKKWIFDFITLCITKLFQISPFSFTRFLIKQCWCKTNLHIFKTSLLLVCHLYAGRIICREQTIGKQVFLPAVSRRLNSGLTFLYSFIYSARLAALSLHCIICCLQWERDSLIWNQTASLFGTRF